ncbi:MAG: DUF3857 domain-containing protein [Wolbachia endosymbiont of Tyrophagus putrescentiae]|nr:DUF3857 domain-containing protein [Wolbachia endosymbiont of Tyrophagus putrescentiae]
MIKFFNFLFYIVLLIFFASSLAEARWSEYQDASVEVKLSNTNVDINQDGTYEVVKELRVKILKEEGRSKFSLYNFTYNENSSEFAILEAKTIFNGKEYIITQDMIEDKPLASLGNGFDQLRQVIIPFPKIEVGSEVYFKYRYIEKKVPVDNFYGNNIFYSLDGYSYVENTKIRSELPLKVKVNDPRNSLRVVEKKKGNIHYIDVSLKKTLYEYLTNEPGNGVFNIKHATWLSLSSLSKWEDLAEKLAPGYNNVINQQLPSVFKAIKKIAANKDTDEDKINSVTSLLSEKIQYMGDWRTVSGRYFPRDLKKIADSRVGDCKDFSASSAAILRELGYKAQPILVMRGTTRISNSEALPYVGNFNHAMLKVTNEKSGKVYWIDPTNVISMAQGIFPDIANKAALLLDSEEGGYIKIPNIQAENSKYVYHTQLTMQNGIVNESGEIYIQGESAISLAGAGLYYSNEQLRDIAFHAISGVHLSKEEKLSLKLPDLTSRIVKDLVIQYEIQQKNRIFKTNLGPALTLVGSSGWLSNVLNAVPDQVSGLFIDVPHTIEKYMLVKDIEVQDCQKLDFEINSPWLRVKKSCKYQDNGTEFIDIVSLRKSFITNEELKSAEYKKLKNELENYYYGTAVIIRE